MHPYTVTAFRHDLADLLTPHSITITSVTGSPDDFTVETRRSNGTERCQTFTLCVPTLLEPMAPHFATMVEQWYAAHH